MTFIYSTTEILRQVKDPTAGDIKAKLAVLADGVEVAKPKDFLLLKQPKVALLKGQTTAQLSTLGTDKLRLRVMGVGGFSPEVLERSLEMRVAVPGRDGTTVFIRTATNLKVADTGDGTGDRFVEATPPESPFPTRVFPFLAGKTTGRSRVEQDMFVFYRPHVAGISRRAGSLDGGTEVALTGKGLVPVDLTDPQSPKLDFSRLALTVVKGGRQQAVSDKLLRREVSSGDRLAFTMPPSPDGLPGPAEIRLEVVLPSTVPLRAEPPAFFNFGALAVSFGPRGAVLRQKPIAIELGAFVTPLAQPDDLVAIYSNAGSPQLQLYGALGNGLLTRLAGPLQGADPRDPLQTGPVDVCVGDFDSNGRRDVFIVNRGTSQLSQHTVLLGQDPPSVLFLPAPEQIGSAAGSQRCRTGHIDSNGVEDVVILSDGGFEPRVFFSADRTAGGPPLFMPRALTHDVAAFDDVLIVDLDGGAGDEVVLVQRLVTSGTPAKDYVRLSYYAGPVGVNTKTKPDQELLVTVPGYTPSSKSRVVGVHPVGDGQLKHLALVLEGIPKSSTTPPTITVLRNGTSGYQQPVAKDTINFKSTDPVLCCSTVGDLDADKVAELVVAFQDGSLTPVRLFRWSQGSLVAVASAVDTGTEPMTAISHVRIGNAVGPGTLPNEKPRRALFVVHQSEVDGLVEQRVTTLTGAAGPKLISPDGYVEVKAAIKQL
ncbi:MAG: hypothetical protein V3U11_09210, partial [Planctomycetota bacterium]